MTGLRIIEPRTPPEMEAFRRLNWEYRDFLLSLPPPASAIARAVYAEPKYRATLDAAETGNRPPNGLMRLVLDGAAPVGCGTVQTIASGDAEIKRVWIAPGARGLGAGRALMERLIADCRDLGFSRILMDTAASLAPAIALYGALGFRRRGPYQDMPPEAEGVMIYFEMRLD